MPPGFVPACLTLGQRASIPDADAAPGPGAGRHPSVFVRKACTPRAKLRAPGETCRRHALPMFQNTVAGARKAPVTFRRQALGCQ